MQSPLLLAAANVAPPLDEIRRAVVADLPYGMEIAAACYPGRDVWKYEPYMRWVMEQPDRLVLIGPHSIGAAQVVWKYALERKARLDFLAAKPVSGGALEALRMVRIMIKWAKEMGATGTFQLSADTGVDFGPFAARLGGRPVRVTRYEIPL